MHACEAVAARGRIAAASQEAADAVCEYFRLREVTPEELAADDTHDTLSRVAESTRTGQQQL